MTESSYTHAGGVVIKQSGDLREYLIVQSSTDSSHWVLPKGHIESGETPEVAAIREVREEAGIVARIIEPLEESRYTFRNEQVRVLYFAMQFESSVEPEESRLIKWCDYKTASATLSFADAKKVLDKANELSI